MVGSEEGSVEGGVLLSERNPCCHEKAVTSEDRKPSSAYRGTLLTRNPPRILQQAYHIRGLCKSYTTSKRVLCTTSARTSAAKHGADSQP